MPSLKIANNFTLPIEAVTQTFAILAKRGAGKSYTASVMVEEMLEKRLHPVVLDPLGVWWGLQSSADGKSAGFPITVLGGDHGDVPLEPTAGETIADFVVNERQPVVLDLSHFRKADQVRFATAFSERLYQKNRDPLHLVVDEADLFAPQSSPKGHESRMLGAMEDLSRRGRARGIGMTLVTQRSAVLNKNVLTQIEVLVVMRTTSPQDRKAIKAWVDVHGEEDRWYEMDSELPKLPVGTAYLWSPGWLDEFRRIEIRKRTTFDSSATPKVGERRIEPTKRAEPDLDALRDRIASTIEEAKRNDPKELRKRIRELEREVEESPVRAEPEIVQVEVPVFPPKLKAEIKELLDRMASEAGAVIETVGYLDSHLDADFDMDLKPTPEPPPSPPRRQRHQSHMTRPSAPPRAPKGSAGSDSTEPKLRAGARKMLEILARHYPLRVTKSQLATLSGFAPKGGTYNTYYGTLKRSGFMVEENKEVSITQEGFDYLGEGAPREPLTTEERIDMWRGTLRAGAREMLDVLVELDGDGITKEELAERTGFAVSGGTFNTYLGTLRRNGLAEVDGGEVRAGEALFV